MEKIALAPHGITVNSIVPSKIETDMLWNSLDEKGKADLLKKIPARRFGTPEEIGSPAAPMVLPLDRSRGLLVMSGVRMVG